MLIDSHAHLEMPQFEEDLEEVIQRAAQYGINQIITVGTDLNSSRKAVSLAERHPSLYAAVGIHPHDARKCTSETLGQIKGLAAHPKVVALGEMGLDFYRNFSSPEEQVRAFRQQIRLARELDKPIIVHNRNAHALVLRILREELAEDVGGVIHCYNGDLATAQACVEMGFYISIPGTITFKNATRLRNVVRSLPIDRLLLETDAPFLAPVPFRGKRNEPAHLRFVADRVAKIRKIPLDELSRATSANTRNLFGLDSIRE